MENLEQAMKKEHKTRRWRIIIPNLTQMQKALLKQLTKNEIFKVVSADKNCGFVLIETEHLTGIGVVASTDASVSTSFAEI